MVASRAVLAALLISVVYADFYINSPRGSNNKLTEQNNNRQNANRLFDSQNNAAAGYQVGDNCDGICHTPNNGQGNGNYDSTLPGARMGKMYYYTESYLYIEWTAQHGCGTDNENTHCDIILQYMCDEGVRDGEIVGNNNDGGIPDDENAANDPRYGRHESYEYYVACRKRERNKGLFIADQNLNNRDYAVNTRQNNGPQNDAPIGSNQRNQDKFGYECPEERDYYPYWHPTPWIDIAIITSDPQRCNYYMRNTQNHHEKGYCTDPQFNNQDSCINAGAEYLYESSWNDKDSKHEYPECIAAQWTRDNHHGNAKNGQPDSYMWKMPKVPGENCVLRIRYNNTSDDYDGWEQTADFDAGGAGLTNNPNKDFLQLGVCDGDEYELSKEDCVGDADDGNVWDPIVAYNRLNINTAQFFRVFEDRTHVFEIRERPKDISRFEKIWNYNVRGRRGNIQQVYPAVEYDFVPPNLVVHQNDYIHFQWTGSDANANNAGNGRTRTDRSNLMQISNRRANTPLQLKDHTMFLDGMLGNVDVDTVRRMAFLDQATDDPEKCCYKCTNQQKQGQDLEGIPEFFNVPENCCNRDNNMQSDEDDPRNCNVMNAAPAYFDGGLVKMYNPGTFHIMSSRNNAYTNRSQKETITVLIDDAFLWAAFAVLAASVIGGAAGYVAVSSYTASHPGSALAAIGMRPFPCCCCPFYRSKRYEEKRAKDGPAKSERWWAEKGQRWLWLFMFLLANVFFALYGFFVNYFKPGWENLFVPSGNSVYFCLAKLGGNVLNFNCSIIIVPVLRNFISWIRTTALGRHIPVDYNIEFHKTVAYTIAVASTIHIVFHYLNFVNSPNPIHESAFFNAPGMTGHLIALCMMLIFATALPERIRRNGCICCRKTGYNVFWNVHKLYYLIFPLLWFHTQKFWIWSIWIVALWAVEKALRYYRSHDDMTLESADHLGERKNVLRLRLDIKHFNYAAGQYLYVNVPSVAKGEWHPFTISSAPEENLVEVHIRVGGDWTTAVQKHIMAVQAEGGDISELVKIDGPYGSASEYVYEYPVAILVGAGIGVTPFAAVLKSMRIRLQRFYCDECRSHEPDRPGRAKPYKVYFYWLCRNHDEFEWFSFLLDGIAHDPIIKKYFEFNTYMTGEINLATLRETIAQKENKSSKKGSKKTISDFSDSEQQEELTSASIDIDVEAGRGAIELQESSSSNSSSGSSSNSDSNEPKPTKEGSQAYLRATHAGKPNWNKVFAAVKAKHAGEEVGVFLCGPPVIGVQLANAAFAINTFKPGDTRFHFHKENF